MRRSTVRVPSLLLAAALVAMLPAGAQSQGRGGPRQVVNEPDNPLLRGFEWREIGPVGQGGRVDDIAAVENDVLTYYIGFATGGLWKTTNNGTTFESIFDEYGTHSIGDIAIAPSDPDIVYVGTGEANNRQSSSFGEGMYKTTDGGRTFTHIGLRETQSIGRVVVHPTNPDIVWVAAVGHLFGPNPERGVFKTTDGGRNWRKVLYVDENTGASDLVIDPSNPNVLFASTYQRRRTACCFVGGGPGSGIWKSTDGGENWTRLSGNGLPNGTMGRVALDISRSDPRIIYAQIEVAPDKQPRIAQAAEPAGGQGGRGGRGGGDDDPDPQSSGVWVSQNGGESWEFRSNQNPRPMYFSQLRIDPNNPNNLFIGGVDPFKSTDGGRTWQQLDNMGHVDNHAIWIDPNNSNHVMYGNDGSIDVSWDAGETWESIRLWAVGQPYHVSVSMQRPYYVCTGLQDNGSWCGPSSVRGGSILAQDWFRVAGGDGFYSAIDPTDPNIIYAESQNGNISRRNLATGEGGSVRPRGPGGGGRGGRGGGGGGGNPGNIEPAPPEGTQIAFNWNTPFMLSPHNPSTLYVGGNHLFISRDRGETYRMTPDLTKQIDREQREIMGMSMSLPSCGRGAGPGEQCILSRNDGVSRYGTIVSIAESPVLPGVLWVGTDDGNIQVSRDGGNTWTEVSRNLPGGSREFYVSRVEASYHDPATAFVSLDGHRSDDLRPYVFVTRDYGQTWTSISSNLPAYGNVNTIRQDPKNPNLLYVGTEFGFFVSLDQGASWDKFMPGLPVVRVDDVVVHPRDNDLVLATHGRSVMIMDDITALQQLTPEAMAQDAVLFAPRDAVIWQGDTRNSRSVTGSKNWRGQNAPTGTAISYYLREPSNNVTLTITDPLSGRVFRTFEATGLQGLNRVQWNLRGDPQGGGGGGRGGRGGGRGGGGAAAEPGAYVVNLTVNGRTQSQRLLVLEDVWADDMWDRH